jgi:hypothetical protein
MNKLLYLLLILLLLSPAKRALASTPTPVPPTTVPFVTPTSQYQGIRPTPSPIYIAPATPVISLGSDSNGKIADSLINGYRMANLGNAMDILLFFVLAGLVISIIFDIADSAGGDA